MGKIGGVYGDLGGLRRNGYCVELLQDASLVELYESARSSFCAISLTSVYSIQAVWTKALESRPIDLRGAASPERGKKEPPQDLLLWADLRLIVPTSGVSAVSCDHTSA